MQADCVIAEASAVVLTGGKSSRMGRPKALLPFDGEPLVVHVTRTLADLFGDVVVVAAPDEQFVELSSLLRSQLNKLNQLNKPEITLVRDETPYQGPVAGIYYGLRAAREKIAFVTSCDAPFLSLPLIAYLAAQSSDSDVVVPYWQERFQPLHAVYRKSVAPFFAAQLEQGDLRPISVYKKVRTREVHEAEIRRHDPAGWSFFNMNTPADYEDAVRRWADLHRAVHLTVELFSVARLRAKTDKVELTLPEHATLSHVFSALAEKLPALVGAVIEPDGKRLTSGNACNINGKEFVRDPGAKVRSGDNIFIISADAGG